MCDNNIGWASGLIDGEGSFYFRVSFRTKNKKRIVIEPEFSITMSEGEWANRFTNVLNNNNIKYFKRLRIFKNKKYKAIGITVKNKINIITLCNLLKNHCTVKRKHIELMIKYVKLGDIVKANQNINYDMEDIKKRVDIIDKMHNLNIHKNRKFKWTREKIMKYFLD